MQIEIKVVNLEKQKGKDMTVTERNNLVEICKTKKDGVYSKKPYKYAVKNGGLIGYSDYYGIFIDVFHGSIHLLVKLKDMK